MDVRTAVSGTSHFYLNKARATYVMLARASTQWHLWRAHRPPTPSLMRGLIQTQVEDQKRTAGTGINNPLATHKGKWCCPARPSDVVSSPLACSVTNSCARRTVKLKTVPRVTNLYSAAHFAHRGSLWYSLKKSISTHNQSMQCHP